MNVDPGIDYYGRLGIGPGAGPKEIKRAYRSLAKAYHPDTSGHDGARFRQITEAREVLCSPGLRARYDHLRAARLAPETPSDQSPLQPEPDEDWRPPTSDGRVATADEAHAVPLPRPVSEWEVVGRLFVLPFGLFFWSVGAAFFGAGCLAGLLRALGATSPPLLVWPFAILGAIAYLAKWTLFTFDLHERSKYFRDYVAAIERERSRA